MCVMYMVTWPVFFKWEMHILDRMFFFKIKEEKIKQLFCTANNIILHLDSGVSWDRSLDYYNWFTPFIGTTYKSQLYLEGLLKFKTSNEIDK